MNRAVVKFDSLPDTNRARSENDDFLFPCRMLFYKFFRFILIIIGRVEVWRFRCKFCRAGVYHLIGCIQFFVWFLPAEHFYGLIQESHLLGFFIFFLSQCSLHQGIFHVDQIVQFVEEPSVDFGNFKYGLDGDASFQRFIDYKDPLIITVMQIFFYYVGIFLFQLFQVQGIQIQLDASNCLHHCLLE